MKRSEYISNEFIDDKNIKAKGVFAEIIFNDFFEKSTEFKKILLRISIVYQIIKYH